MIAYNDTEKNIQCKYFFILKDTSIAKNDKGFE